MVKFEPNFFSRKKILGNEQKLSAERGSWNDKGSSKFWENRIKNICNVTLIVPVSLVWNDWHLLSHNFCGYQEFGSRWAKWFWFMVSHETAVKTLARDIVIWRLDWTGSSASKKACSHGHWKTASVPCCCDRRLVTCYKDLSIGLLEHSHSRAAGLPQSEWSKMRERKTEATMSLVT